MIYLYAIADGLEDIADVRGLTGEPMEIFRVGESRGIGGLLPEPPPLTRETLHAQDQVVRALHARAAALLPMRFGSAFQTEDDVTRALTAQSEGLVDRLDRVRHREQMALRVFVPAGSRDEAAAGSKSGDAQGQGAGAEYLRRRARPEALAPLLDALASVVCAIRIQPAKADGHATVYHLIERGNSTRYQQAVAAVLESSPGLTVRVSGPAPCYAFAALI